MKNAIKPRKKGEPLPKRVMNFYSLRLNEQDLDHLQFVLEQEIAMQEDMMDTPDKSKSRDGQLEDWVIARDMKCYALRVLQMIIKVKGAKR